VDEPAASKSDGPGLSEYFGVTHHSETMAAKLQFLESPGGRLPTPRSQHRVLENRRRRRQPNPNGPPSRELPNGRLDRARWKSGHRGHVAM